ncbi:MAG TPA: biotin--[acetyl-CoA-carboxylase] ligase [Candidatus Acidoferrales bacterium]|jgi:BirA family biotin operon repressor/biotin-[acetyl-CoA-carboxylase] ligase|nr:biotin--[acetyl-CoA-carboxylase] ligase [Candidatus Acidoferrales bacterium]
MEPEHPYARIASELTGTGFSRIRYVEETTSTNADASALLGDDGAAGVTIVAEYQSSGAGRKGRSWLAEPGSSLLFTTIVPGSLSAHDLWVVPFWTALAIRRSLGAYGVEADLHWPNDLLLGDAKLAGILCVSRSAGDRAWVACGVGINVRRGYGAGAIEPPPAYCDDVRAVKRAELLRTILLEFEATRAALENPQRVAREWEAQAGLPGRRYRLLKDGETAPFEATALALATGGGLAVARDDGTRETISLADARALRSNHR